MSERPQALIRAAFDVIAEVGFEGLRLRQVAERVGIDHSTLHHYFATKDDLVAEVVAYATRQFWPTMPPGGSHDIRLRGHLRRLSEMIEQQPTLFVVLQELDLRGRRDATVQAVIERHEAGWRSSLAGLLEAGVQQGLLSPLLEVPATVELIIATVKGTALVPGTAGVVLDQLAVLLASQETGP